MAEYIERKALIEKIQSWRLQDDEENNKSIST